MVVWPVSRWYSAVVMRRRAISERKMTAERVRRARACFWRIMLRRGVDCGRRKAVASVAESVSFSDLDEGFEMSVTY